MRFSSGVIKKLAIPIGSTWTFPPASSVATIVSIKTKTNKKNIETNKTTKVDSGDGVCNSKVSCLTLNDATEKEYPKSEVNSGSLNNAIIDDPEFANVMRGSALVLKEILKDETKEIIKLALKLEETGNVGSDVDEGTEATLTDTETEIAGVAKVARAGFDLNDTTGNVELDCDESAGSIIKDTKTNIGEVAWKNATAEETEAESLVDGGTVVTNKHDSKDEVASAVKAVLAPSISSSKKSVEDEHMGHFSDTDAKSNIMNADIIETLMEIIAGGNEGGLGDFKFSNTGKGAAKGGGGSGEKNGTHVAVRDSGSYSNKDVVDESGGENGACIGSKHFDAMDDTKADGHLNKVAPYDEVEEQGSDMSPKLWENATAEETKAESLVDGGTVVTDKLSGHPNMEVPSTNTKVGAFVDWGMVVTDERDGNNMDEVVSAVNTAFASPCSSISSKKSCEDKVPGSIQGDKNHSNSVAKSSEMSSGTENFSAGHDLEGLGDSKSTNKEVVAAAVEGVVGSGYHTGEGESIERNVGGNGKSTIRMRRDKILTLGHFKRLMIMLFLCSYFSSCYVAADDIKRKDEQPVQPGLSTDFKQLIGLRGNKNSQNSVGVIENVKKFMLSLSNGVGTIQRHYQDGDVEEAGKAFKVAVGNIDTISKSIKDMKPIQDKKDVIGVLTENDENDGIGIENIPNFENIPNSMIGDQIDPEVLNKIVEFSNEFLGTLEDIDLSKLQDASTKKKTPHLSSTSRLHNSKPPPKNKQQSAVNFENDGFDATPFFQMNSEFNSGNARGFSNFMKSSTVKNIHRQMQVQRKGILLPKLSTLVSIRDYETVVSKHRLRQAAMEVCLPECDISDTACNCLRLFDCVKKLDEYDMAALTAGGFIDSTAGSENYGKTRVGANELNLYNVDGGIGKTLQGIKEMVVDGDPNDSSQCNDVLSKFFTACDPNSESCSNANQHTFQATIDQVCEAVNTKVKLNFEVIGDEFDGFVDEGYEPSDSLSYASCAEFVAGFDRLYEVRNKIEYSHPNPMLRDPNAALSKVHKVKIQHDSSSSELLNIGEVEVYDQLGTINRALDKNASQSSDYFPASNLAPEAVDGNPNTFSHTQNNPGPTGAWWMVDMQMYILVSKVVIKNRLDCCKSRLSNTTVSLLDKDDNVVGTYRIGDASGIGDALEVKDFSSGEHVFSVFTNGLDNSLCMDVKDGHPHNGTSVQLSNCNGSDAQKWFVDSLGRIHSKLNVNRCVEAGASDTLYARLFVSDCHYDMHQQWIFQSDGRIRNKQYVKYIGVQGGCNGVSSGTRLELHNHMGSVNCGSQQQWIQRVTIEIEIKDFNMMSVLSKIQFPLAYNFPQNDHTGVVDRSFTQKAFKGGPSATLTKRKFSLVDPKTNMALSVVHFNQLTGIDIGVVGTTGSSTVSNDNMIEVSGAGSDIWGTSDSFHYLYGSTSGDASIEMFVEIFTGSSLYEWAKAGLMLRDSLNENSKHFSLCVTGSNGLVTQWRSSAGGATSVDNLPGSSNRNMWLKITKTGNVFQAYYKTSASNSIWSTLGSSQTIDFGSGIFYYGVAVTSHETTRVATLQGYMQSLAGLKMTAYNEAGLSSQQFRITKNDQLESISCPGQVLSIAIQATSWMCKKNNTDIGLITVGGSITPLNSECNSKNACNNDCTIDPTPTNNDYCVDGNKLLLKNSSPGDISQKWRFYHNGIMNLACKREPLFQGLVISQVNDNDFRDLSLFEDLELSFVNNGMAISVGGVDAKRCFETRSELRDAIVDCSSSTSQACDDKKATFGYSINGWCFNGIQDMSGLFKDTSFNEPINGWDVSGVENMMDMFRDATQFNQDLSAWNTGRVTDMTWMFGHASEFNGDISTWNVGKVTSMTSTFQGAIKFNNDISSWRAINCNSYLATFHGAVSFNQDLSQWHTTSTMNFIGMFNGATAFNQNLCAWKGRFNYNSNRNHDMFKGTSCADKSTPSEGARYVKLQHDPSSNEYLHLDEVEVYDQAGIDRALHRYDSASQSSTWSNDWASNAVDGRSWESVFSPGTISHTKNDYGAWWQVDLGSGIHVNRVRVWNRRDEVERLAPVTLSLHDQYNTVIWQYKITESRTPIRVIFFDIFRGKVTILYNDNRDASVFTITPRKIGRNFCVQECTTSGENNVNIQDKSYEEELKSDLPILARHPQYMSTIQDTTSQNRIRRLEVDDNYAAPILSDKQIEYSQLDEGHDINKNLLSDKTTSQESNTNEEQEIENSHNYDAQHTKRPPHHTENDSLSTLSSSNLSNQALSYKVTVEEYTGGPSQLFKYRKASGYIESNPIFNIVSVDHPLLYLTLSKCAANADILLLPINQGVHWNWIIKGSSIVNLCTNKTGDRITNLSIDMTGMALGDTFKANIKNDEGGQKWTIKSNDVVLSRIGYVEESKKNANQTWIPHFVNSGYDLGLHPGFPGAKDTCNGEACLSSVKDRYLAKEAMRICDESMSFLLGSQISVGTLKTIVDSIVKDGSGRMPGYCCMDVATTSEFWGYNFDPKINGTDKSPMECQNKGLWHLGISDEACENAGGEWFRTPCLTLKDTIDNRPSRFDLENPVNGTCQDNLKRLETAFVSSSTGRDFPFAATRDGCHEFCRSLPDYSTQIGMMTNQTEVNKNVQISDCTCIYRNDKLPSRESMPSYSKPSPPKFTLSNSDGMALGLRPNINCNASEDLMIETQVADLTNPRQQFQVTHDGQVVSVQCPQKVLTNVLGSGGVSCTDGVGLQLKEYGYVLPGALTCFKTKSELREAIVACSPSNSQACEDKKAIFGSPINSWCFNGIPDMSGLFKGTSFNEPINGWDVSGVENMKDMFRDATQFNQDLSAWNTERVTDMTWMFGHATEFNGDISTWNVSSVISMQSMFNGATAFNQNLCAWEDRFSYNSNLTHDIFNGTSCADKSDPCSGARYVKLQHDQTSNQYLLLAEVQVWDQAGINQALHKSASQSSLWSLDLARRAVDGDVSTISHTNNDYGAWWEVDLGSDILVDKVIVLGYLECCQERLAPVTLYLYDQYMRVIWQYRVIDSTQIRQIDFDISGGQVSIVNMDGSNTQVTVTSRKIGRNFCVKDCTASWERNDVNIQDKSYEEELKSDLSILAQRHPQYMSTIQDTTSQNRNRRLEVDDNYAAPILSDTEIENSQLVDLSDLQHWTFNNDTGSISNVGCPNLVISSIKEKDASLNSIYFALQNPRTQLAIGITAGKVCTNGTTLSMQDLKYGSLHQQFIYIKDEEKIVSLICPDFSITIPNGDCGSSVGLHLSSESHTDDRNKWSFQDAGTIQSVKCLGKYITIHGALSGGAKLVRKHPSQQFLAVAPDSTFGGPPKQNDTTNSPTAAYTDKPHNVTTQWGTATPPSVGSIVTLSDLNAERYQKWTKQRQLFQPLMGPFSVVNPNNGLAMAVDGITCSNGASLSSSTDDHASLSQQFYLGQHGSIFSAQCPGLVLAVHNSTNNFSVALEIFQINQNKLKWKFANGMVESVLLSGMFLASNPSDNKIILKSNSTTSDSNMKWIRMNTRLLASNSAISRWKQDWKVAFVDPEYKGPSVTEFIQDNTALNVKCYKANPAFSASFDDFAKELVVNDASDEDQCRKVRETLGFDKDYPFDIEVCDNFHQHQCDPFFTGIDHTSGNDMEGLSAPPKFEMVEYTPVEYEAVEYEGDKYLTVDYEEFSRGDDLGDLTEAAWPDLYIPEAGLGDLTGIFDDSNGAENQDSLVAYEGHMTRLGHAVAISQKLNEYAVYAQGAMCDMIPENICAAIAGCVTNPVKFVCGAIYQVILHVLYGVQQALEIALYVMEADFGSLGADQAIYGYYYSRATYHNTKHYNEWNERALDAIRLNMKDQHTEMKRQLQERHKDIANHVGQDIADSQNALGQAIVDAQNDIGKGIVDSQNALGQGIVDAQNALGQDIVDASNYITEQHNALSDWLHKNLCIIYTALNGTCAIAIGPLQENQAHLAMQLYWPEGQLNIMEKIDQLQTTLPLALQDNLMHDHIENANISSAGGPQTIKDKMDALSSNVQENAKALSNDVRNKVDALSNDMRNKVDAVESKVDAVESKVDALSNDVQNELRELKDMMTKLMEMIVN